MESAQVAVFWEILSDCVLQAALLAGSEKVVDMDLGYLLILVKVGLSERKTWPNTKALKELPRQKVLYFLPASAGRVWSKLKMYFGSLVIKLVLKVFIKKKKKKVLIEEKTKSNSEPSNLSFLFYLFME